MERDARRLQQWKNGFESLVTACACQPVATMRELLAFWLDIMVLEEACGADAGGTRLCVEMSPTSPWVAISRGGLEPIAHPFALVAEFPLGESW